MNQALLEQLGNPIPSGQRAIALRRNMDLRLLRSLSYLISVCEKGLGKKFRKCQLRVKTLLSKHNKHPNTPNLSPTVYAAHWQLYQSLKSNNARSAHDIIQTLGEGIPSAKRSVLPFPSRHSVNAYDAYLYRTLQTETETEYHENFDWKPPSRHSFCFSLFVLNIVLQRFRIVDPDGAAEFDALIAEVRLLQSSNTNAGSSFPAYGCIYLRALSQSQNWTAYLEHIVHECAHHYLFAVIPQKPILKRDTGSLLPSPLRVEPRPLSAIYHQMFVLARVIRAIALFQRAYREKSELRDMSTNYQNDTTGKTFVEKFWLAAATIRENASLTAVGAELLDGCCEMVETFSIDP